MGANLSQSQEVTTHFQAEFATFSQPPQSKRIIAIQKGLIEAKKIHPWTSTISQKTKIRLIQPDFEVIA